MRRILFWAVPLGSLVLIALLFSVILVGYSHAQEDRYPSRPISIIVPYGAGGGPDINARLVAAYWTKKLGEPLAIINKPGAAGLIGYREIAHSKPDGYTLGALQFPNSAILVPGKGKNAGFANEDMVPLGTFTNASDVFATGVGSTFKTFEAFVQYARKNPGKVSVAVPGDAHILAVLLMEQSFGVEVKPVLFKSAAEASNAVMGGHVQAGMFISQFAITGREKLVPLALTGSEKVNRLEDVPTFKSLGHDIPVTLRTVFAVPKGTPEPIILKLSSTLEELNKDQEFIEKVKGTGAGYGALFGGDIRKYYKETCESIGLVVEKNKAKFAQ